MREIKYLSPSSIHLWQRDREAFYQRYLSVNRPERTPQTLPCGFGSGFDALVKSYIYKCSFGNDGPDDAYNKRKLFEEQVDEALWDDIWPYVHEVFDLYKKVGCVSDLMLELERAVGPPNFEFTINDTIGGVPLLGKPDMFFISKDGMRVIYDWKCNALYAKSLKSPAKGYLKLRELGKTEKQHKLCTPVNHGGIMINAELNLEEVDKSWADQLSVYSWLLGETVGSEDWVAGIDQICGGGRYRFATHRCRISGSWGHGFFDVAKDLWDTIQSGHIFKDMTESESKGLCSLLDEAEYVDDGKFF